MTLEWVQNSLAVRLQEAAKVLHLDASHSAMQSAIQKQLAANHRAANPDSNYYDYPYLADTYGDPESGTVVHHTKGKYTMSQYKKEGDGYSISNHKAVKPAYVVVKNDAEEQKESVAYPEILYYDGVEVQTLAAKESAIEIQEDVVVDLREACFDANGVGNIKLIAPGHGSTGYYSPEVLKEAASKGVFDNAQMFIDHATEEEEAARPEGSVKGLAAKGGKATYQEAGAEGPGVYTQAKAYNDFIPFLNERAKDIGVSIRARGRAVVGQVGGKVNNIVKSLESLKSADFVTRAGAGGKLVPLMESFRASKVPVIKKENVNVAKVEIEESELTALKESAGQVPKLMLAVDRNNDRFNRIEAKDHAATYLKESKLPVPAQARLLKVITNPAFALPVKDGVLDTAALTESLKTLVTEEAAYLKESGAVAPLVAGLGGDEPTLPADEVTKLREAEAKSEEEFGKMISNLSGVKRPTKGDN